jgi:hypothetical protein
MMNLDQLYNILSRTTAQFRKGEAVVKEQKNGVAVTHIYGMPHVDEAKRPDVELVDLHFVVIGVDTSAAAAARGELIAVLAEYPDLERLKGGPSYIEVGAVIGDRGATFQLFALGKVLKLWTVITPTMLGFEGAQADEMAGSGFVMMSGYDAAAHAQSSVPANG